jgi:hypothetical protein
MFNSSEGAQAQSGMAALRDTGEKVALEKLAGAASQQPALVQATVQVMSVNMFLIWLPVVISTTITTTDTMTRIRAYSTMPWPRWALRNRFTDRAA